MACRTGGHLTFGSTGGSLIVIMALDLRTLQVLSSYLVQRGPSFLRNKTVLELGSGTGLVGLVAGYVGAEHVWITDQRFVR